MLDVHRDTLRRYIRKGIVSAKQLPSGHWRIDEESVMSLVNRTEDDDVKGIVASLDLF